MSAASQTAADAIAKIELAPPSRPASEAEPTTKPARWVALDLLRFVAVLMMVQGHTFTTLLSQTYNSERWHRHHDFVHGYTAPMFLFGAGLAFGVTTFRGWDKQTRPGPALNKRIRRYVTLILIGYFLHLPAFFPSDWRWVTDAHWRAFAQVDVLQHIGVSLGLLQLAAILLKKPERLMALVSVLFAVVVFGAPMLATIPVGDHVPLCLAGYLNAHSGSMFSLVPWAGFTWAGLLTAYAARRHPRPSDTFLLKMALATALVVLVPIAINRTGFQPYGDHQFWRTDPYYFFFRLGNVMLVLTALMGVERTIDRWKLVRFSVIKQGVGLAETVGQETLIVYVAHLMVLHGSVVTPGLQRTYAHALNLNEAVGVTVALTGGMIVLAVLNARLKRYREARSRRLATA